MLPYRSTHRSYDCDVNFKSRCKHARGGFGNLKKIIKILLAGVLSAALQEYTVFIRLR